ncbi:MAG: RNA-binding protein [Thermodesulfobacteriota bacterium]
MKLYVGNFSHTMTESGLETLFSAYGEVESVRIITDHYTRQSKCFGYVIMAELAARNSMTGLDGRTVDERILVVREARPRDQRLGCGW